MASSKERDRWEAWFDKVSERMSRQKQAIDRLLVANTEMSAALFEITAMADKATHTGSRAMSFSKAVTRSQEALDRVEALAAAVRQTREELDQEGEPEDPRRRK